MGHLDRRLDSVGLHWMAGPITVLHVLRTMYSSRIHYIRCSKLYCSSASGCLRRTKKSHDTCG